MITSLALSHSLPGIRVHKIQEDRSKFSIREQMPRTVTIGRTDLSKYVKDVQFKQIMEPHSHRLEATIVLDATALGEYYFVNLHDPVVIENEKQREFSGVVVESYPIDSKILALDCRSAEQHLQELIMPLASFQNFTPQEMVYYLVKQTSDIDASENSIHGLSLNKLERDFFVAVPVHSLSIKNPITVSNVTFSRLEPISLDTKVMLGKGKWIEGTAIASITIRSTGFIDSWTIGRDTIARLVDALSYGATLSTIGYPVTSGTYKTFDWQRADTLSKVSLGPETYLRDMSTTPPKIWIRSEPTREHGLELIDKQSIAVQISGAVLQTSYSVGSLVAAVRWLRLGTQENDLTDRLLDYWVSFEFLVSNEKASTFLSAHGLKDLESAVRTTSVRKADGSIMTPEELHGLSSRITSRINNVDLRERFDAFLSNRKRTITITSIEYGCIWGKGGLREQRNDLEHGRSVHVDSDALKTMKHVLDKMILAIIT